MTARPPRRGWSSADAERKVWEPVMVPKPVFDSRSEMESYEDALASTPRLPGEELHEHMARVAAKAQGEEG